MEYVEPLLLPRVGRPGIAPIQESADHTGVIDGHLGFSGQLRVVPYSRSETAKRCGCFPQPDVQLGIQGEVVRHSRPKIVKAVDNFQLCVVNEDGGRWRDLAENVSFLQADREAKFLTG